MVERTVRVASAGGLALGQLGAEGFDHGLSQLPRRVFGRHGLDRLAPGFRGRIGNSLRSCRLALLTRPEILGHRPVTHRPLGAEAQPGEGVLEGGSQQFLPRRAFGQHRSDALQMGQAALQVEDELRVRRHRDEVDRIGLPAIVRTLDAAAAGFVTLLVVVALVRSHHVHLKFAETLPPAPQHRDALHGPGAVGRADPKLGGAPQAVLRPQGTQTRTFGMRGIQVRQIGRQPAEDFRNDGPAGTDGT